jgi:hypothetical protein
MQWRPRVQPDDPLSTFIGILAAVRRRLVIRHAIEAAAAGIASGAVAWLVLRWAGVGNSVTLAVTSVVLAIVAGVLLVVRRRTRTAHAAAAALERAGSESRNLVVTAEELIAHPHRARPWVRDRVLRDAAVIASAIPAAAAVPLRRPVTLLAGAAGLAVLASMDLPRHGAEILGGAVERLGPGLSAAQPLRVVVTVQPPAYTGLKSESLADAERLTVVQGTALRLTISGEAARWRVRFAEHALDAAVEENRTIVETTAMESGYFAISRAGETDGSPQRLIPVSVTPDRAPVIKVEEPGKDLLVPDANRSVRVRASATDDYGLHELTLRYTKVSGSGEQFEFVEGQLPFEAARADDRNWTGRGEVPLNRLGLEPGDSLVYRVVARDARPGDTGSASSDTFFIEVAGPGQVPLEGFEMPPDRERYALSQQMIVLKIQRLRAKEPGLAREALQEQAGAIAVEQRSVRANFVFLMGGHVEDEEEEAAHSHEIQEGRLENTARQEMSRAVSHMSHAEQALLGVDTAAALEQARLAVEALQRAFGRNRYLLRTLPVRSRIDPSRRLSGKLDEAGDWRRAPFESEADTRAVATRQLLTGLLDVAPTLAAAPSDARVSSALTRLAEQALAVDPGEAEWQQVSRNLLVLRDAVVEHRPGSEIDRRFRDALGPVVALARKQTIDVTTPPVTAPGGLHSAWAEEVGRR